MGVFMPPEVARPRSPRYPRRKGLKCGQPSIFIPESYAASLASREIIPGHSERCWRRSDVGCSEKVEAAASTKLHCSLSTTPRPLQGYTELMGALMGVLCSR